jgi:hypothetical protein
MFIWDFENIRPKVNFSLAMQSAIALVMWRQTPLETISSLFLQVK